ncbi:MAG: hypothetical protein JSS11_06830 [Verrucomicrobia bacterium]|nr:hypothetical protein [Verrucomicrobiota bacterium]
MKIVWGNPAGVVDQWWFGLWGFRRRDTQRGRVDLIISGRGLTLWLAGAVVAAYVGAATVWYNWQTSRRYSFVTYTDALLLPVRRAEIREAQGRALIEEGLEDLDNKRWSDAAMKLRSGLERAPHHWRARLALARFNLLINQRAKALQLLTEDLAYGYPGREYLEFLFGLCSNGEDYDRIIQVCDRFEKMAKADGAWLLRMRLQALLDSGRAKDVLKLAAPEGETAGDVQREAQVLALIQLNRGAEAARILAEWRRRPDARPGQVLPLEVRVARLTGRFDDMARAQAELQALAPNEPRNYLGAVTENLAAGREAEAERALQDYFFRFGSSPQNLLLMATELMKTRSLPLLRLCVEEAAAHSFADLRFRFLLAQRQMELGDLTGARATLAALEPMMPQASLADTGIYQWLRGTVAAALLPDAGLQSEIAEQFRGRMMPASLYRQTAETLLAAGRTETAARILDYAKTTYPDNPVLGGLRERTDVILEAERRRAAAAVPVVQPVKVTNEKEFFDQLEIAAHHDRWTEAGQQVRDLRLAKPAWLPGREPDLMEWEMRIAARTADLPALLGTARLFLNGDARRADRALRLAVELRGEGVQEMAATLLREVLARSPDFKPALRLKAAWQPQPGT